MLVIGLELNANPVQLGDETAQIKYSLLCQASCSPLSTKEVDVAANPF